MSNGKLIYCSFEMAKYLATNYVSGHNSVNRMIDVCRVGGGEICLSNGDKIMWRKDVGWFIKTY
jgi:hypothetical protein